MEGERNREVSERETGKDGGREQEGEGEGKGEAKGKGMEGREN